MPKTRVLIADDHAILRAGLRLLIDEQPDMEVVGEAASADETIDKAGALAPGVVTLDVTMPGGPFSQTIRRLLDKQPGIRIVMLTMHDDPAYLRHALAAGASGFVVKRADSRDLLAAIRALAEGRTFVDVSFQQLGNTTPLDGMDKNPDQSVEAVGRLSAREREVLVLLAGGHTNQEIANRVHLSVKTVETYRARIAEKLGLRTRAQLTRFANDSGMLTLHAREVATAKDEPA